MFYFSFYFVITWNYLFLLATTINRNVNTFYSVRALKPDFVGSHTHFQVQLRLKPTFFQNHDIFSHRSIKLQFSYHCTFKHKYTTTSSWLTNMLKYLSAYIIRYEKLTVPWEQLAQRKLLVSRNMQIMSKDKFCSWKFLCKLRVYCVNYQISPIFAMHEKDCHLNGLETFSVRLGCSHIIVLHNTTLKRTNLSLLL